MVVRSLAKLLIVIFVVIGTVGCSVQSTIDDLRGFALVSFEDTSIIEGSSGNVKVTVSRPYGSPLVIPYVVTDISTSGGSDYTAVSGTVTIPANALSVNLPINTVNNSIYENSETFEINFSAPGNLETGLKNSKATVTINDDESIPTLQFTMASDSAAENVGGLTKDIIVTLSGLTQENVTFDYGSIGGTATGSDYSIAGSSMTIAGGSLVQTIVVTHVDDNITEPSETAQLSLSNPSNNAIIGAIGTHTHTIIDDETAPDVDFALANQTILENVAGGVGLVVVNLSNPSATAVVVAYTVSDSSATGSGADYTMASGSVTFAPMETTKSLSFTIVNDVVTESLESFVVTLGVITGGVQGAINSHTVNISDDDSPPMVTFITGTSNVIENIAGGNHTVAVQLTNASVPVVTVDYAITGGTATGSGTDYTLASGILTFSSLDTAENITVPIVNDNISESNETFQVTLSAPTNASLGAITVHDTTILDNDGYPEITYALLNDNTAENVAGGNAVVNVVLGNPSSSAITVNYSVTGGTASGAGVDYTLSAGTLTFAALDVSEPITIPLVNDTLSEGDETIILNLSGNSINSTIGSQNTHTHTIVDDEGLPRIAWASGTYSVSEGVAALDIVADLDIPGSSPITVNYVITPGSPSAASGGGVDYTLASGTLTFPTADTSETITATIIDDNISEIPESFVVTLSSPSVNAQLGVTTVTTATITDNDGLPAIDFALATGSTIENIGSGVANVVVNLSNPSSQSVTVNLVDDGSGSSTSVTDYTFSSPTIVTFAAGETVKTIAIGITNDDIYEASETIDFSLSSPSATAVLGSTLAHIHTILDNEAPPTIEYAITNDNTAENAGPAAIVYVLNRRASTPVTADYSVTGGTATGSGTDYTLAAGTITVAAMSTLATLLVPLNDDSITEGNENFILNISSPSANATLGAQLSHTHTIIDNEGPPTVFFGAATFNDAEGIVNQTATVQLSNPSISNITVDFAVTGGTATGGGTDYTITPGTITFTPGLTAINIPVTFTNDTLQEPNETITLMLSNIVGSASFGPQTTHVITIIDDDNPSIQFASAAGSTAENVAGGNAFIVVNMSNPSVNNITVNYQIVGGSTTATGGGTDYTLSNGTLTFAASETTKTLTVPINDDTLFEGDEDIAITLSSPSGGATIGTNTTHVNTIIDNESAPEINFASSTGSTNENVGGGLASIILNLNYPSSTSVTVNYSVSGGTAITGGAGADYTLAAGTATFTPGQTLQTITASLVNDSFYEGPENFIVDLASPSGGVLGAVVQHTHTINDDEIQPVVEFSIATSNTPENVGSGQIVIGFTVTSGSIPQNNITFDYIVNTGSSTATGLGTDFTLADSTFTILTPAMSGNLTVPIVNDTIDELNETIVIDISNPSTNATLGARTTHTATILDNDSAPQINFATTIDNINENDAGGTYDFIVNLTNPSYLEVTVDFALSGTATGGGTDYTLMPGTITFAAGSTVQTVTVSIIDEVLEESDETIIMTLSNPSASASLGLLNPATLTIIDNDMQPFTWTGLGPNSNFSTATNWSSNVVPGVSDVAIFSNACSLCNVTVDVNTTVSGLDLKSTYTGTITHGSGISMTTGTGDIVQAGGTYNVGNGILNIAGDFTKLGGTFTPGTSTVVFNGSAASTVNVVGSELDLYNFTAHKTGAVAVTFTGTYNVANNFTHVIQGAGTNFNGGATFNVSGDATVNKISGWLWNNKNYNLRLVGSGPQALASTGSSGAAFSHVEFASSGTVTFGAEVDFSRSVVYTSGTVVTTGSITYFTQSGVTDTISVTGISFNDVGLYIGTGANVDIVGVLDVNGDLIIDSYNTPTAIDGGEIRAASNVSIGPDVNTNGGTTALTFDGSTDQIFTHSGGKILEGTITVNKSGGNLNLASNMYIMSPNQDLDLQAGTINMNGNRLEINDQLSTAAGTTINTHCGVLYYSSHSPALGTINNGSSTPGLSVSDVSSFEGDPLSFVVSMDNFKCDGDVVFDYQTADVTTSQWSDYTYINSTTATIGTGVTNFTINVATTEDSAYEPDETFNLIISNPVSATLVDTAGLGTIQNDDTTAFRWTGLGGGDNWSTAANWSGGSVPGPSDSVLFDGTCTNCTSIIDSNIEVANVVVNPAYPSSLSFGSGVILRSQSGFYFGGGTLNLNDGTLRIRENLRFEGGTVNIGTSTIEGEGNIGSYVNLGGVELYNLKLSYSLTGGFNPQDDVIVNGDLIIDDGELDSNYIVRSRGNVYLNDGSSNTHIRLEGNSNQNVVGVDGDVYSLEIASTGGVVTVSGDFKVRGDFTHTSGVVDLSASVIEFDDNLTSSINAPSLIFGDVVGGKISTGRINIVGSMTIGGDFSAISGTSLPRLGTVYLKGDFNAGISASSGSSGSTLVFDGTGNQLLSTGGTGLPGGAIVVNKASGLLNLNTNLDFTEPGQSLDLQLGTINMNGYLLDIPGNLSTAAGTTINTGCGNLTFGSHSPALGTINNGSSNPNIYVSDLVVSEDVGLAMIPAYLDAPNCGSVVSINYSTSNVSAISGSDYIAVPSTPANFPAGTSTIYLPVTITDDGAFEATETFNITIDTPVNGTIADATAVVSITDNDTGGVIWSGLGGDNLWSNGANWVGGVVPISTDIAVFNNTCIGVACDVSVNVAVDVLGIFMQSTYTGTISQGSGNSIDVGSAGWSQDAGSFTATTGENVEIVGPMLVNGGAITVSSSSHNFVTQSDVRILGGTHSFRQFNFDSTGNAEIDISSSAATLSNSVRIRLGGTYELKQNLVVSSSFSLASGVLNSANASEVLVSGNINGGSTFAGGTGTVTSVSTGGAQSISITSGGVFPNLKIERTGGTLTATGTIVTEGDFTYISGTADFSAATLEVTGAVRNSSLDTGAMTFQDVILTKTSGQDINLSSNMNVNGTLTINMQASTNGTINGSTILANGDVTMLSGDGGTSYVEFTGGANQTLTGVASYSGSGTSQFPRIRINKSGGTLTLVNDIELERNWVWVSGTIDPGTSRVVFSGGGGSTLDPGTQPFYNLYINKSGTASMTLVGTVTVANSLELNTAGPSDGGVYSVGGDVTMTNNGGGTAGITFTGGNDQGLIETAGVWPTGTFVVNKSGGSVVLGSAMNLATVGQDLDLQQGTIVMDQNNLTINDNLSTAAGTTINTGCGNLTFGSHSPALGTIIDGVATPNISISDISGPESANLNFIVSLDAAKCDGDVSFSYATGDGMALALSDYTGIATTAMTIPSGSTTGTISVSVLNDTDYEASEAFFINLSSPINGIIADNQAVGTILDDDTTSFLWTGAGGNNNWTTPANWSGGVVPTGSNIAHFDSSCGATCDATVNSSISVAGLYVHPSYTGVITQSSGSTIAVGTKDFQMYGGTLNMVDNEIQINRHYIVDGGTINWGAATATFNTFQSSRIRGPALSFNNFNFQKTSSGDLFIYNNIIVNGNYIIDGASGSNQVEGYNGFKPTITILGDVSLSQCSEGYNHLIIAGTSPQNIVANSTCRLLDLTFASVSDINVSGQLNLDQDFNYISGNVNWGTSTLRLVGYRDGFITSNGLIYGDVELYKSNYGDINFIDEFTVNGHLQYLANGTSHNFYGARVRARGNISFNSSSVNALNELYIDGTGSQLLTVNTGSNFHKGPLVVNKSGGALTLGSSIALSITGQDLDLQAGVIDMNGYNLTINDTLSTATGTAIYNGCQTLTFGTHSPALGTITTGNYIELNISTPINVTEGTDANAIVPVTLSRANCVMSNFDIATSNSSATQPGDYTDTSGNILVPIGNTVHNFTVPIINDGVYEPAEYFNVTLSSLGQNMVPGTIVSVVNIADDDTQPAISIADSSAVTEGSNSLFVVSLSNATYENVTFNYDTSDNTAVDTEDYTAASASATIASGNTSVTLTIPTTDDTLDENDGEEFVVTLSNISSGATAGDLTGSGFINDNDAMPTISVADITVSEGIGSAIVTATLSAASGRNTSFAIGTSNNTAFAGSDYTTSSSTLTIPAYSTSVGLTVPILDDSVICEADIDFITNLSGLTNIEPTGTDFEATITIEDDDGAEVLVTSASAVEGANLDFVVQLGATCNRDVVFNYRTFPMTAYEGDDYTLTTAALTLNSGATSIATISVPTVDDTNNEPPETMIFAILNDEILSNTARLTNNSGAVGTINDNDNAQPIETIHVSATGDESACAVSSDGRLKCWGTPWANYEPHYTIDYIRGEEPGEMGDNLPTMVASSAVKQISSTEDNTCYLETNGDFTCFGTGSYGVRGNGSTGGVQAYESPTKANFGTNMLVEDFDFSGDFYYCARVYNTGTPANKYVKCYGYNTNGQDGQEGWATGSGTGDTGSEVGDNMAIVNLGESAPSTPWTVKQVDTGDAFACAILGNDRVKCWGQNTNSQLGNENSDPSVGDQVGDMGNALPFVNLGESAPSTPWTVKQIASGTNHTCAILGNDRVKCWGYGNEGRLGYEGNTQIGNNIGDMGNNLAFVDVGTVSASGVTPLSIKKVVAGANNTCAITSTDQLKCWGNNSNGQLGQGHTQNLGDGPSEMGDNLPYIFLGSGRTVKDVAIKRDFICAHLDDDSIKCWGKNYWGTLGQGDVIDRGDNSSEMGDFLPAINLGTGRTVKKLGGSSHDDRMCVVLDNDTAKCWGSNDSHYSLLGFNMLIGDEPGEMGVNLPALDLGTGVKVRKYLPLLSMYGGTNCALLDDGDIKCWGRATYGIIPHTPYNYSTVIGERPTIDLGDALPYVNIGAKKALDFSGSDHNVCVHTKDMGIMCWGYNTNGELGLGHTNMIGDSLGEIGNYTFVDFGKNNFPVKLTGGNDGFCAVLNSMQIKCWGNNDSFMAGNGTANTESIGDAPSEMGDFLAPVDFGTTGFAGGIPKAVDMSHMGSSACALFDNGKVKCWGEADDGQLGQGDTQDLGGPGFIGDAIGFLDFGTGKTPKKFSQLVIHDDNGGTCALMTDGTSKCWGDDAFSARFGTSDGDTGKWGDDPNEMGDNLKETILGSTPIRDQFLFQDFGCSINNVGALKCWAGGSASYSGVLGQGNTNSIQGVSQMGDNIPPINLGW